MIVPSITITGIDAYTNLSELPSGCEIGVLYAAESSQKRHPGREDILRLLQELSGRDLSLHVCGIKAKENILAGGLPELTILVQRIQINGPVTYNELLQVGVQYPEHTIITQDSVHNKPLLTAPVSNHVILVDGSSGRGVSPDHWERPVTDKIVGYAVWIGYENIIDEIQRLQTLAAEGVWIDMEGCVRDSEDLFDTGKANAIMGVLNSEYPLNNIDHAIARWNKDKAKLIDDGDDMTFRDFYLAMAQLAQNAIKRFPDFKHSDYSGFPVATLKNARIRMANLPSTSHGELPSSSSPYSQGFKSYFDNKRALVNPYPNGSDDNLLFERGWSQALRRQPERNFTSESGVYEEVIKSEPTRKTENRYANVKGK